MMKLLSLAALAAIFAFPVMAQDLNCGPAETVAQHFHETYGESLAFIGEMSNGQFIQIWSNPDINDQSWTAFVHRDGQLCILASGGSNTVLDPTTAVKPQL